MTEAATRSYWVLGTGYNSGAVIQSLPQGSPERYEFDESTPLATSFPSGGVVRYSSDFPKEKKLFDVVCNTISLPVVSARVRAVLEELAGKDCEFLPITLRDHRNKIASKDHCIVHVLRLEDAIDMKRSRYRMSELSRSEIAEVKELRLDLAAIPHDAHVFRARTAPDLVLLSDAVERRLQEAKVTGLRLYPAEGWDGDDM